MKKDKLLKECVEVLKRPHVLEWYEKNLQGQGQEETINSLLKGVGHKQITTYEALCICLIVGFQWKEKFEGTP